MNLDFTSLDKKKESQNIFPHFGFSEIFRSWFWRYYDHLGLLIVYNFLWCLTLFLAGWLERRCGIAETNEKINILWIYLFYFSACFISVGWSYSIFRLFNTGRTSFIDIWIGIKKYSFKALLVSAISGIIIGMLLYNVWFYTHWGLSHRFSGFLLSGFLIWISFFWLETSFYHWPILFFQDPPLLKVFYRSALIVLDNGLVTVKILLFSLFFAGLFTLPPFIGWLFLGFVFFFSFQCVALEKHLLKYKITYEERPLTDLLEALESERQRGWHDFWHPWENR